MKSYTRIFISLSVALLLFAIYPAKLSGQLATTSISSLHKTAELFRDATITEPLRESPDRSLRNRYVTINFDSIWKQNESINKSLFSSEVWLNLFPDISIKSIMQKIEFQQDDAFVWYGIAENTTNSQVIISVKSGILAADIAIEDAFFQIRFVNQDIYIISQVDMTAPRPQLHSIVPQKSFSTGAPITATTATEGNLIPDDGSIITVMVLYTSTARSHAGGDRRMGSLINLAIAETNTAYARSGVHQRLQLVHMGEVGYNESSNIDIDLERLQQGDDKYMDNVQQLRNTYAVDLVNLVINFGGKSFCGVGFGNEYSPDSREYGYSVITLGCLNGPVYGFGHELGHNMGLAHDRANADGPPAFPYAYGYQDPAGDFGDIMSYSCEGRGQGCPTIMNFANPAVFYNGKPTGVDYRAPNSADAARALNKMAPIVANFRSQDHVVPSGSIVSPADSTTSHSAVFHLAVDVQDNSGGSGIFSVAYWALYDNHWVNICTSTEPPFACTWIVGTYIKDQKITFAIHISDYAGNKAIDAGGYRSVLLADRDHSNEGFLPVVRR